MIITNRMDRGEEMNLNNYVYSKGELTIITGVYGRILLEVDNSTEKVVQREKYIINDTAGEILGFFGKNYTIGDMLNVLSKKHDASYDEVLKLVKEFFNVLEKEYKVCILYSETYVPKHEVKEVHEKCVFPHGVMIELTDKCNFFCRHCYGGFEKDNKHFMKKEDALSVIDQLSEIGITSLELTGGEITLHPDLEEIVLYALEKKIPKIGLITNGSCISDRLLKIIADNKERFIIQVDLHGITDDYLAWFIGIPGYLEKNQHNILRVLKATDMFRVVTAVTQKNLYQIQDIAKWLFESGVKHYGLSLVFPEGRAREESNRDLFLNNDQLVEFARIISEINTNYPGFISMIDDNSQRKNCGCVSNCVGVNSYGDLKLCATDCGKTMFIPLGNVFEKGIREIYQEHATFVEQMDLITTPNKEICGDCTNLGYCAYCTLRGMNKFKEIGDKCKWGKTLNKTLLEYFIGKE